MRLCACERHYHAVLATVFIVTVDRLGEEYSVQNFKAFDVARAHAEDDEIFTFFSRVDNFYILSVDLEIHEIFRLREEEVLCAADCVQRVRKDCAVMPFFKSRARLRVDGEIKRFIFRNGGEKRIQLVN